MKEQMIVTINKTNGLILENVGAVKEGQKAVPNGCMRLSGTFGVTGVMNNNQRYYTNDNYKNMVEGLQKRIATEAVFGELEHPSTMNVDLANVTHKIESISIDESTGVVSGTILLLNNEKGRAIQTLVENGLKLKISSRGRGTVSESGEVKLSVLETYDLVYKPGFSQAQLSMLTESVSEDGTIMETLVSELDGSGKVVEKQVEAIDIQAIKEALKAELKAELVAELNVTESVEKQPEVNVEVIESYMTQVVESSISESEEKLQNLIHESMIKFGKATQNWAFESFAPDIVKYLNEKQLVVSKTDLEAAVQGIREWAVTDLAQGIQSWSINELSENLEVYFKSQLLNETNDEASKEDESEDKGDKDLENGSKDKEGEDNGSEDKDDENVEEGLIDDSTNDNTDENIDESQDTSPKTLLERIDEELLNVGAIETNENSINEAKEAEKQKQLVESTREKNFLMDNMPESVKHLWESADEDFKKTVNDHASQRDFVNEGQVVKFWLNRFTKNVSEKFSKKTVINESTMSKAQTNDLLRFASVVAKAN